MGLFLRPTCLVDALAALAERPLTVLAGGTDHFPARAIHAPDEDILSIAALPDLRAIAWRDDHWWLPCLATWTDLIRARMPPAFDALTEAARRVGGMQVQNAGTIVGNLCNASPAADGIPCLLTLDAEVELTSAGGRRVLPLRDFVLAPRRTARRDDELVLGLRIPASPDTARSCFLKLGGRRYLVISTVMVAAELDTGADGRVRRARIAVGACSPCALRLPALEARLLGQLPDPALAQQSHLAALAPIGDVRASAEYRRDAALELVRRAISSLGAGQAAAA